MTVTAHTSARAPCDAPLHLAATLGTALRRLPVRDVATAAALVLAAAAMVHADERLQDWIPDVLTLPDDARVEMDRAIGSSVRMFAISTAADVETLFADWEQSLETAGYPVEREPEALLAQAIEFSGPGIANAKIIVAPTRDDARSLIEFDATLD